MIQLKMNFLKVTLVSNTLLLVIVPDWRIAEFYYFYCFSFSSRIYCRDFSIRTVRK